MSTITCYKTLPFMEGDGFMTVCTEGTMSELVAEIACGLLSLDCRNLTYELNGIRTIHHRTIHHRTIHHTDDSPPDGSPLGRFTTGSFTTELQLTKSFQHKTSS